MATRWSLFVDKWSGCTACSYCDHRKRVVLSRGKLPCDILLVGEAPGDSENILGAPFLGPAGRILDHIIQQSIPPTLRYAMTNLVACIPRDENRKTTEPEPSSISKCASRLAEYIELAVPRAIVRVGVLSREWLGPKSRNPLLRAIAENPSYSFADIVHPAAILRSNIALQDYTIRRCIITIMDLCDRLPVE